MHMTKITSQLLCEVCLYFKSIFIINREREYPTVNMPLESNVTFDHSHMMHVNVHWFIHRYVRKFDTLFLYYILLAYMHA